MYQTDPGNLSLWRVIPNESSHLDEIRLGESGR